LQGDAESDFGDVALGVSGDLLRGPARPGWRVVEVLSLWFAVRLVGAAVTGGLLGRRRRGTAKIGQAGVLLEVESTWLGRAAARSVRVFPFETVEQLALERGGPRADVDVGLATLALGTFVGSGLLLEGLRAPGIAAELCAWGLGAVVLGLAADYGLQRGSLARGPAPARLVLGSVKGRGWALRGVDPDSAGRLLAQLAARPILQEPQKAPSPQTYPSDSTDKSS